MQPVPEQALPKSPTANVFDAFLCRSKHCKYYATHPPLFDELCESADEQVFDDVWYNASHIMHRRLPPESSASQNYSLRPRVHNLQL